MTCCKTYFVIKKFNINLNLYIMTVNRTGPTGQWTDRTSRQKKKYHATDVESSLLQKRTSTNTCDITPGDLIIIATSVEEDLRILVTTKNT